MQDCHCVELMCVAARGQIELLTASSLIALNNVFLKDCLYIPV